MRARGCHTSPFKSISPKTPIDFNSPDFFLFGHASGMGRSANNGGVYPKVLTPLEGVSLFPKCVTCCLGGGCQKKIHFHCPNRVLTGFGCCNSNLALNRELHTLSHEEPTHKQPKKKKIKVGGGAGLSAHQTVIPPNQYL